MLPALTSPLVFVFCSVLLTVSCFWEATLPAMHRWGLSTSNGHFFTSCKRPTPCSLTPHKWLPLWTITSFKIACWHYADNGHAAPSNLFTQKLAVVVLLLTLFSCSSPWGLSGLSLRLFVIPVQERRMPPPVPKKPMKGHPPLARDRSLESSERQRLEARKRLLAAKRAASVRQSSATESADSIEIYIPEAQTRLWDMQTHVPTHTHALNTVPSIQ